MEFSQFSRYLSQFESTSSRLTLTKILSQLIQDLRSDEIFAGVFLSLGAIGPGYAAIEFGVSEKLMLRIIGRAFGAETDAVNREFKRVGDLGAVAESFSKKRRGHGSKMTLLKVFERLKEIAAVNGEGSVEKKIARLSELLQDLDSLSVRYVVRIPLGTMRLGFSEKTVLEALALIGSGGTEASFSRGSESRKAKEALEDRYYVYPNIGEIAQIFKSHGLKGLNRIHLKVGVPILSQLCGRLETAEAMVAKVADEKGEVAAEYKYDGLRLQIHLDRNRPEEARAKVQRLSFEGFSPGNDQRVVMYTRNLEQMQAMFPDITSAILDSVKAETIVLDGEAVGFDPQNGHFIPFQETIQRKRKYQIEEMAKKIPVKYFAFDILYKDGQDLTNLPFTKRREILRSTLASHPLIKVSDDLLVKDAPSLLKYFKEAKEKGLEGLIVKNTQSPYEAGNRGFAWVKFKREETGGLEDTLDCVVLGYYKGTGKRSDFGIGASLVGVFDTETEKFLTIAKIGTGLTDEEWRELEKRSSKIRVAQLPGNVGIKKELWPDVLTRPKTVVVIRADEITVSPIHTSGYALRFPRMMGYRLDKKPEQATCLKEIKQLYRIQEKK